MRCLAKEPVDRPQHASELVRVLEVVSAGEERSRSRANDATLARRLGLGFGALVAVAILARASIIALGLPEWVLPVMLVVAVIAIVVVIGRPRVASAATPLTPAGRGE
jgi:hypothetical protein